MPEICSGIGAWAGGRREKEGESVHGMGGDIPGGCKEIRGGDWIALIGSMYMGAIAKGKHIDEQKGSVGKLLSETNPGGLGMLEAEGVLRSHHAGKERR